MYPIIQIEPGRDVLLLCKRIDHLVSLCDLRKISEIFSGKSRIEFRKKADTWSQRMCIGTVM